MSRVTFSALFAIIGTTFGSGNGATTFNLPDLRGRVPAGMDSVPVQGAANRITAAPADAMGGSFGAETHTLTTGEMPSHTHNHSSGTNNILSFVTTGGNVNVAAGSTTIGGTLNNTGGGGAHNNVQPTLFINWIIYAGV